ncbi:Mur ligase domain-containing protein, partial [Klebsiella pneumoniae]|uniref:Mur ligase domain-containing protein n=1 Tax=Klebsiella pneumoniae TaxID=573 RepID=UPI00396A72B3
AKGIPVAIGHRAENLGDAAVIVTSTAIKRGNPEVEAALEARTNHLAKEGLARRQGERTVFARDLIETLRGRD